MVDHISLDSMNRDKEQKKSLNAGKISSFLGECEAKLERLQRYRTPDKPMDNLRKDTKIALEEAILYYNNIINHKVYEYADQKTYENLKNDLRLYYQEVGNDPENYDNYEECLKSIQAIRERAKNFEKIKLHLRDMYANLMQTYETFIDDSKLSEESLAKFDDLNGDDRALLLWSQSNGENLTEEAEKALEEYQKELAQSQSRYDELQKKLNPFNEKIKVYNQEFANFCSNYPQAREHLRKMGLKKLLDQEYWCKEGYLRITPNIDEQAPDYFGPMDYNGEEYQMFPQYKYKYSQDGLITKHEEIKDSEHYEYYEQNASEFADKLRRFSNERAKLFRDYLGDTVSEGLRNVIKIYYEKVKEDSLGFVSGRFANLNIDYHQEPSFIVTELCRATDNQPRVGLNPQIKRKLLESVSLNPDQELSRRNVETFCQAFQRITQQPVQDILIPSLPADRPMPLYQMFSDAFYVQLLQEKLEQFVHTGRDLVHQGRVLQNEFPQLEEDIKVFHENLAIYRNHNSSSLNLQIPFWREIVFSELRSQLAQRARYRVD